MTEKNEVVPVIAQMPAARRVDTASLLTDMMELSRSNMSGDGKYTDKQIAHQVKISGGIVRIVELELKLHKAEVFRQPEKIIENAPQQEAAE